MRELRHDYRTVDLITLTPYPEAPMPKFYPIIRNAPVKGAFHMGDEAKEVAASIEEGARVQLRLAPDNKYDPYCVDVLYGNVQFGYIPKEISAAIHLLASADVEVIAEITGRDKKGQKWPLITVAAVLEDE